MRTLRFLSVLLALAPHALAAPPSRPGGPIPTCSRIPARIVLVGTSGGQPDTHVGAFEVLVCEYIHPYNGPPYT